MLLENPLRQNIIKILENLIHKIQSGECSDAEIADVVIRINPENNNFYKDNDFINAEEAMKILHLGNNRNRFFALIKKYKIKCKKLNNMNVGYPRKDILLLWDIISKHEESYIRKIAKEIKKSPLKD